MMWVRRVILKAVTNEFWRYFSSYHTEQLTNKRAKYLETTVTKLHSF